MAAMSIAECVPARDVRATTLSNHLERSILHELLSWIPLSRETDDAKSEARRAIRHELSFGATDREARTALCATLLSGDTDLDSSASVVLRLLGERLVVRDFEDVLDAAISRAREERNHVWELQDRGELGVRPRRLA